MKELDYLAYNFTLPNAIDSFIYNLRQDRDHPEYFKPDGLLCFCGEQGSGKTLSAVQYVYNLMKYYQDCICFTNVGLNFDDYNNRIYKYDGIKQMLSEDNGKLGIIYFIDEMHIEFNSLESKGMDASIFELVSQQRKRKIHIVGTSQVFGRLAKPFREQFKYTIMCDHLLGSLFRQSIYKATNTAFEEDIRSTLRPICNKYFFASPAMYEMYDTSQVIERINGGGQFNY